MKSSIKKKRGIKVKVVERASMYIVVADKKGIFPMQVFDEEKLEVFNEGGKAPELFLALRYVDKSPVLVLVPKPRNHSKKENERRIEKSIKKLEGMIKK